MKTIFYKIHLLATWLLGLLGAVFFTFTFSSKCSAQDDEINTHEVFIYSPNERSGLHIAWYGNGKWNAMGQLCSSDYGQWGSEKRMYHPSLCRAEDGTWRLVFQLNDHAPAFAAAYSRDLITWRPQDYPRVSSKTCLEPIVFEGSDGTFDVYYKTFDGQKRFLSASGDFRKFGADEPSQIDEDAWLRDTATVNGKQYEGNKFEITTEELDAVARHFDRLAEDARQSSERMHDDAKNAQFTMHNAQLTATLKVDLSKQKPISDKLIGIFFEDISYAADGGLYAELVQNRDFEYNFKDRREWNATTAWHSNSPIRIDDKLPLSKNNPHYAVVIADSLINEGWDGIAVEAGQKYNFSMYVFGRKNFLIALLAPDGTVIAKSKLKVKGDSEGWEHSECVLTATQTESKARLLVLPQGKEEAAIDMISLFPEETFMHRKNGLRRDLAQVIADMKPKFVRFPGGCMSHGQGLDNIYHWNETVGPLQDRKPDFNIWGYHQTRGLGFYEYFQFCEDIGAEPLPVLAAGVPCQNSAANVEGIGGQQGGIPMAQMPAYIQELLNLIDWANGDPATSKWARMRADAGHPEPFYLKYIGIGNEDIIGTVFEERYEMICRAIRQKYPDIKICGTVGPFHTPSADYVEGWDFVRRHPDLQYMVDEHYYESTGWFMHHRDYYDNYPRESTQNASQKSRDSQNGAFSGQKTEAADSGEQKSQSSGSNPIKVYLGEWAASTNVKRPNVETALTEALYLTDIERNGDIVEMTSYAPMLCKDGHSNWNPDMIYFSNTEVRPTPAYHVQKFFSTNSGDTYFDSELNIQTADMKIDNQTGGPTSPEANTSQGLSHRIGASVVRDSKTGHRYVKLVNALPVALQLTVSGLTLPVGTVAQGFEGKPEDQQLTMVSTTVQQTNSITLPPYSFRVIDLKE